MGQPPEPVSRWMVRRPAPLMEAASMRGRLASQSVQNKILGSGEGVRMAKVEARGRGCARILGEGRRERIALRRQLCLARLG